MYFLELISTVSKYKHYVGLLADATGFQFKGDRPSPGSSHTRISIQCKKDSSVKVSLKPLNAGNMLAQYDLHVRPTKEKQNLGEGAKEAQIT